MKKITQTTWWRGSDDDTRIAGMRVGGALGAILRWRKRRKMRHELLARQYHQR